MISSSRVFAMIMQLAPHTPRLHAATVAGAIASVSSTVHDAAVLVSIEYQETSIMPGANYEFGLTCCAARLEGQPLDRFADTSLAIWRTGWRIHHSEKEAFFYYFTGRPISPHARFHSSGFRRIGRRGIAYAHRCQHVLARLLRMR